MGKTETIKERAIYVYLSSIEQKERWQKNADNAGVSISKFVVEHVENSLRQEEEPGYKSRGELWKEINRLRQQVRDLLKKCRLLETVVERQEQELRRYRAKPFLDEVFEGRRGYEKDLVSLLKNREIATSDQLLAHLGVDPSEFDLVKAVSKQLENLEAYGLVKSTPRGWKWIG
ncbi:MAG: hypothetical protein QXZ70_00980 [Candidatus Bathyarchaeia archaeon]